MIATASTAYIKVITRQIFIKLFFTPAVVYDSRVNILLSPFSPPEIQAGNQSNVRRGRIVHGMKIISVLTAVNIFSFIFLISFQPARNTGRKSVNRSV